MSVRLWDPESGEPIGPPLTGHRGAVAGVALLAMPNGEPVLVSTARDGTVRLWSPTDGGIRGGAALPGLCGAVVPIESTERSVRCAVGMMTGEIVMLDVSISEGPVAMTPLGTDDGELAVADA